MQFFTDAEAAQWCQQAQARELNSPRGESLDSFTIRSSFPQPAQRLAWFAAWLVLVAPSTGDRLLWVKQTGVWPSSENWTLVSRFRAGYGEVRPFDDSPAALGSAADVEDLAALAQIGLISGWDFTITSGGGWFELFVSHDEWVEYRSSDSGLLDSIRAELQSANVPILPGRAV